MAAKLFLGIDLGTQGVRIMIVTEEGNPVVEKASPFPVLFHISGPLGWFEQDPAVWWKVTVSTLKEAIKELRQSGYQPEQIQALGVDSTSGTIIALDQEKKPLREAIMYNDSRANPEAQEINKIIGKTQEQLGYTFDSSFGLPKILWLKHNQPEIFERTRLFIHAADYLIGRICGEYGITDYTNALKTGYNVITCRWPDFIEQKLGIPLEKLPKVCPSGTIIAPVAKACAEETGLSETTLVVSGMTDGCASQVASGAISPGTWNTTIGTTLVVKGVTCELLLDREGRIYSHRHPEGFWMPGGASNTGGDCLAVKFAHEDLDSLNQGIANRGPSGLLIYPLLKQSERFPFRKDGISGFLLGKPKDRLELYQGYLEGVGYIERLSYDLLAELGANRPKAVYIAGGAVKSEAWSKIRANILNKKLVKPKISGAHIGAAILASANTFFTSLTEAASKMVKIEEEISPEPPLVRLYEEKYEQFRLELKCRNYL